MSSTTNSCIYQCPHCLCYVETRLEEINCKIFRHGILKVNGLQIDPHLPKLGCDQLVADDAIYGCGGPYMLHLKDGQWVAEICGSI